MIRMRREWDLPRSRLFTSFDSVFHFGNCFPVCPNPSNRSTALCVCVVVVVECWQSEWEQIRKQPNSPFVVQSWKMLILEFLQATEYVEFNIVSPRIGIDACWGQSILYSTLLYLSTVLYIDGQSERKAIQPVHTNDECRSNTTRASFNQVALTASFNHWKLTYTSTTGTITSWLATSRHGRLPFRVSSCSMFNADSSIIILLLLMMMMMMMDVVACSQKAIFTWLQIGKTCPLPGDCIEYSLHLRKHTNTR